MLPFFLGYSLKIKLRYLPSSSKDPILEYAGNGILMQAWSNYWPKLILYGLVNFILIISDFRYAVSPYGLLLQIFSWKRYFPIIGIQCYSFYWLYDTANIVI